MSADPRVAAKLQQAYDALITEFLAPLLSGRDASLGRPLAPGALDYFARAQTHSAQAELDIIHALHRGGSEITMMEAVTWPTRDLVAIAMVLHNLLYLTDPSLDRIFVRGARNVILEWIDQLLSEIDAPATRAEALARHAMVSAFLKAVRRDTVVTNWAYTYRFYGRPPPPNVVAFPRVRLVHEEHSEIELMATFSKLDEQHDLGLTLRLRDLLSRSPVTELCRPDRANPLRFGLAILKVLSDRALRGGIARTIAGHDEWAHASVLGAALAAPELRHAKPALLVPLFDFLLEIHLTATLDTRREKRLPAAIPVHAARYAAVLLAWLDAPALQAPFDLLDSPDRGLVTNRAHALRKLVPRQQLAEVHALLSRARFAFTE